MSEISDDPFDIALEEQQDAEPKNKIKAYIFGLLARREYSKHELTHKLREKNYPMALIKNTLIEMAELNYQSDLRCAQMLLSHGYKSKWGPNKIRFQMQQKGIAEIIINQAFEADTSSNAVYALGNKQETIEQLKELLTQPITGVLATSKVTEEQWCEQAKALALKKFGADYLATIKNDLKNKAKLQRFLYNKGFEQQHINLVIQFYNSQI